MKLTVEQKKNVIELLKDHTDYNTANLGMKIINDYLDEYDDIEFAKEVAGYYRYGWKFKGKYNGFAEFKLAKSLSIHEINELIYKRIKGKK